MLAIFPTSEGKIFLHKIMRCFLITDFMLNCVNQPSFYHPRDKEEKKALMMMLKEISISVLNR